MGIWKGLKSLLVGPDVPVPRDLFNQFSEGSLYASDAKYRQDHLFEQYKLYVEMAEQLHSRKQATNTFFSSINTALIGLLGYLIVSTEEPSQLHDLPDYGIVMFSIGYVGFILSFLWQRMIHSFRNLDTAKFRIIREIEERLPLRLYDAERQVANKKEQPVSYISFFTEESVIPALFAFIFLFLAAWGPLRNAGIL